MQKSSVNRNLQIGFGVSLLLLIISSVASYISIRSLISSAERVQHTNEIISEIEGTMSALKDAETSQRGYLLSGNEAFLDVNEGTNEEVMSRFTRIESLISDNRDQQLNYNRFRKLVLDRLAHVDKLIEMKRSGEVISLTQLQNGKKTMDATRDIAAQMETAEKVLLEQRVSSLDQFATFTPILILIAALISLVITVVSYLKVNRDFAEKARLQTELEKKDQEITGRINLIQVLAAQISDGNYVLRINDEIKDGLGSLADSLDRMANSLQQSFLILHAKEKLQAGLAAVNQKLVGEKTVKELTGDILEFIADYTSSHVGAFYLLNENGFLDFQNGYAFTENPNRDRIKLGSGVVGQVALDSKRIVIKDIAADDLVINFASGELKPAVVLAEPIFYNNAVIGVIELASTKEFTEIDLSFLSECSHNIGIAVNTSIIRRRQQDLLEETQAQTEELQTQHSEMESLNFELETQTQKIQASEEELRVQQEELLQSNQELEEKGRMLEEMNQLVVERNQDISQKAEQLELSTKYKSEFLANMSHELRTPLNSILLLSRLMSENKDLDTEQVEYAQVIQNAGQGLLSLIDEILDLSKIEAGKMELEYEPVDLQEIANDMRSLFEPVASQKDLDFKVIIAESAPKIMVSDKMRLQQVLKNLLSNAIKFTSQGSVELKISQPANSSLISFCVKDTGTGIAPEKQHLIFEAFQQEDGSTRRKFGGTGLGLSISRELAKLLKGEIKLSSKPGTGSEFNFLVPVAKPVGLPVQNQEIIHERFVPPVITTSPPADLTVLNIPREIADDRHHLQAGDRVLLIVEDDTNFARALMDFSRKQGYKCLSAVRGDQGIAMAEQYKPLAILLDIQLPVKDGWQVMQELKSNPATRHIPVHIMSSMEVKKESLLKGAVDFINKPVALEQMSGIFARLEDALTRHPKKVLIIEENQKHAKALSYFLGNFNIHSETSEKVQESISLLQKKEVDCVILDMGVPDKNAYETLEEVKKTPGLENLPIIIFTGKNLSKAEENRIKHYADSIVVKTAHSYQRILDEVGLFLHIIEDNKTKPAAIPSKQTLGLNDVLENKTVLIADDDVRNIFALTKALEKYRVNIISATDGKEALKQLEENPQVDAVLMDMMMPEMDGYESTARIRENPKYKNLPVLAVTAKAMTGDREKCIRAGASDYISKPVDADQLISLLRVWLYDQRS